MGTIRTLARFRNPDITSDINHRLRNLIQKGVFYGGGQVSPVAGSLEIDVQPFASIGADGMVTLLEGSSERLSVGVGSQWVLLHAEYKANDIAIAVLEVKTEAQYNALTVAEKLARIKLAKLDVGVGASEVTSDDISYNEADFTDPIARSAFRGIVQNVVSLPDYTNPATGLSQFNREGDYAFVIDDRLFYSWDVSGTPQWRPVISSAGEAALDAHRNNEDDGTVPPDLYEAQHITVKERHALDSGSGSQVQYGSNGVEFDTDNPPIDYKYPLAIRTQQVINTGGPVTSIHLSGRAYVGLGAIGTAKWYFSLSDSYTIRPLFGPTDGGQIKILSIFDSTNTFQINPSTDADALGFVEDPWIRLDFGSTGDTSYNGEIGVWFGELKSYGEAEIAPLTMTPWRLPFAEDVRVSAQPFEKVLDTLPSGDRHVQGVFNYLDEALVGYDNKVVTIGNPGSNANYVGNSQAVFSEAINDVTDGTTIIVLPGNYAFSSPVSVNNRNNICIRGTVPIHNTSSKTWLPELQTSGSNAILFTFTDCSNIVLQDLAFDETPAGGTDFLLIFNQGHNHQGPTIKNCLFYGNTNTGGTIKIYGHEDGIHGVEISGCVFDMDDKDGDRIEITNALEYRITNNTFSTAVLSYPSGTVTAPTISILYSGTNSYGVSGWITDNTIEGEISGNTCISVMVPTNDASPYRASAVVIRGNRIFVPTGPTSVSHPCFYITGYGTSVAEGSSVTIDQNTVMWGKCDDTTAPGTQPILGMGAGLKPGVLHVINNKWETNGVPFNFFSTPGESQISGNWIMSQVGSNDLFSTSSARVHWTSNTWLMLGDDSDFHLTLQFPISFKDSVFKRRRGSTGTSWTRFEFQSDRTIVDGCIFDFDDANTTNAGGFCTLIFTDALECAVRNSNFIGNSTTMDVYSQNGVLLDGTSQGCSVTNNIFRDLVYAVSTSNDAHRAIVSNNMVQRCCTLNVQGDRSIISNNHIDQEAHPYLASYPNVQAIDSSNAAHSVIAGNTVLSSASAGIPTNSSPSRFTDSVIICSGYSSVFNNTLSLQWACTGIYVSGFESRVVGNHISSIGSFVDDAGATPVVGIYVPTDRNVISNNTMESIGSGTNAGQGVQVNSGDNNVIANNTIRLLAQAQTLSSSIGINIANASENNTISANQIMNAWVGIYLYGNYARIHNNNITDVVRGIVGEFGSNLHAIAQVSFNRITLGDSVRFTDNDDDGIAVDLPGATGGSFNNNFVYGSFSLAAPGSTNGYRPLCRIGSESICFNRMAGGTDYGVGLQASTSFGSVSFNSIGNINGLADGTQPDGETCGILITGGTRIQVHGNTANDIGYQVAGYYGNAFRLRNVDRATFIGNSIRADSGMDTALVVEASCDETIVSLNQWDGLTYTDSGTNTLAANNNP